MQEEKYYVYELAYPDDTPFYYGKGCSGRIDTHERDARTSSRPIEKLEVIRQIWNEGDQVKKRKIAFFSDEQDAYMYEWAMIYMTCASQHLVNEQYSRIPTPSKKKSYPMVSIHDQKTKTLINKLRKVISKRLFPYGQTLGISQIASMALGVLAEQEGISVDDDESE